MLKHSTVTASLKLNEGAEMTNPKETHIPSSNLLNIPAENSGRSTSEISALYNDGEGSRRPSSIMVSRRSSIFSRMMELSTQGSRHASITGRTSQMSFIRNTSSCGHNMYAVICLCLCVAVMIIVLIIIQIGTE